MQKQYTSKTGKIIQIDEEQDKDHLGELVRGTVERRARRGRTKTND